MDTNECKVRLCACSFGLAFGITTGLYMVLLAWAGHFFGYGIGMVNGMASLYIGYAPTVVGGLIGGIWGLVDGFIFGIVAAWIYNCCLCCHKSFCKSGSCKTENKQS